MTRCGAAQFLRAGGPTAVPLRACCAAALIRAAGGAGEIRPSPFVCRAAGAPVRAPEVVGSAESSP